MQDEASASAGADASGSSGTSRDWERWLAIGLGAYFAARLVFFAVSVAPGIPPDEATHLGLAKLYAGELFRLADSPATWSYGPVGHEPFLYHWLMGRLLALDVLVLEPHVYLRLWNAALSLVTVGVAWKLGRLLLGSPVARILFLVLLTNTLMFTFLSASVNYDNLANGSAVVAVWCMVRHWRGGDPRWVLGGITALGVGALTKISFLPVAPLVGLAWLAGRRGHLGADLRALGAALAPRGAGHALLLAGALAAVVANLHLYGTNLVRFGRPVPGCEQVLELKQCLRSRIFARNWVLARYHAGDMTFEQAMQFAAGIPHPSDRRYAQVLLRDERRSRQIASEPMPRYDYLHFVWDRAIKPTVFGIQAHHSLTRTPGQLVAHNLVLLAGFLLVVRGIRFDGRDREWLLLGFVVLAYYGFLVGVFNYGSYRETTHLLLGVQGRYVFHVLVPAYLILAEFFVRPFGRRAAIAVALVAGGVFVAGDLPFFARHDTPGWYTAPRLESAGHPR